MHRQKIKEQEENHSTSSKHLDTSTESDDILSNVESPSSVTSSGVSPQEKRFRDSSPQSPPQNQLKPVHQKRKSPPFDDVTSSVVKSQNNETKKRRFESRPAMTSSLDVLSQIFPARSRSSLEEVLRETNEDLNRALEICARTSSRDNHRKIQHASKTFFIDKYERTSSFMTFLKAQSFIEIIGISVNY